MSRQAQAERTVAQVNRYIVPTVATVHATRVQSYSLPYSF